MICDVVYNKHVGESYKIVNARELTDEEIGRAAMRFHHIAFNPVGDLFNMQVGCRERIFDPQTFSEAIQRDYRVARLVKDKRIPIKLENILGSSRGSYVDRLLNNIFYEASRLHRYGVSYNDIAIMINPSFLLDFTGGQRLPCGVLYYPFEGLRVVLDCRCVGEFEIIQKDRHARESERHAGRGYGRSPANIHIAGHSVQYLGGDGRIRSHGEYSPEEKRRIARDAYEHRQKNFFKVHRAGSDYCGKSHWVKDITDKYDLRCFMKQMKDKRNTIAKIDDRLRLFKKARKESGEIPDEVFFAATRPPRRVDNRINRRVS